MLFFYSCVYVTQDDIDKVEYIRGFQAKMHNITSIAHPNAESKLEICLSLGMKSEA